MPLVRLAPEYGCSVIYPDRPASFDVPIPGKLADRIRHWELRYEGSFDESGEHRSEFIPEQFDQAGHELWRALEQALGPGYQVTYYSISDGWLGQM